MLPFSRVILMIFLLCHCNKVANAQHWQWVKDSEGTEKVVGYDVATDASGNSFVVGYFTETVKLAGFILTSSDQEDVFLVKYNPAGEVVWAKSFGGIGRDYGFSIALDKQGNIFIAGGIKVEGIVLSKSDVFISKYGPEGNLVWTQTAGGTGIDVGSDIALDDAGNIYLAGRCGASTVFGDITVTNSSASNFFLAKYDPSGKAIWVKSGTGTVEVFHNSIGLDGAGNIYLAGGFKNATTIGNIILRANGFDDMFLAKFDPNGQAVWAKRAGGSGFDFAHNLAIDAAGNCYIAGDFSSRTAQFDAFSITNTDKSGPIFDMFIAKYDAAGEVKWVTNAGGPSTDHVNDIAIDAQCNSYITGYILDTSTFGTTTLTSDKNYDVFTAKLNPAGEFVWAKQAGGPLDDHGNGIAVDGQGNGYVTGAYHNMATFDNFKLDNMEGDMFIAKFGPTPLPEPEPEPPLAAILLIPNIITPNGDGLNDTFAPVIPENIPVNLKVYNRWGQLIYEQADYQNTWDGENQANGAYYYLLTTATGQSWKGWIEINR